MRRSLRFSLGLCLGLLGAPTAQAGEPCDCDPGGHGGSVQEPEAPPSYSVRWFDSAPVSGFRSIVPLGDGRLLGAGQFIWRFDGERWHRQRGLDAGSDARLLGVGDGRLVWMRAPSPEGSTAASHPGAMTIFARGGVERRHPPSECTLSHMAVVGTEVLACGQCVAGSGIVGVVVRLEGDSLVELGPRPPRPIRAIGSTAGQVFIIDEMGAAFRLMHGRWRRHLRDRPRRGPREPRWRTLGQASDALLVSSDTGLVVRIRDGALEELPALPGRDAILELVGTEARVLARTHDRLWLWDGVAWRDRGATPNDCGAVDYCTGRITQLSAGGHELWALRDGVPERQFPGPGAVPFFAGRAIDEMAVGARGELYWTRHDATGTELLRTDGSGTHVVPGHEPVFLWAGADGTPHFVDTAGGLYRQEASGAFEGLAQPPCRQPRLLLGRGDRAYFSCGEAGVLRVWTGRGFTRLMCPAGVCTSPADVVRVAGSGFPLSQSAPGSTTLLMSSLDGSQAIRQRGHWRRADALEWSVQSLEADATDGRRVDSDRRVWALLNGRLVFDGPDSFGGGRSVRTSVRLPALSRIAISGDASVIWGSDLAGRLFRLTRD